MSSVLETLRKALGRNSNHQEHDYLYPHARALESGLNLRNLPMPPVDKVFICLRMTKATSFSDYFLNMYSPREATLADLIIVNGGLYWMFRQCKHAVTDPGQKADFEAQAVICRDNLETILANLPFHQPSKLETVSSMIIACIYCLETCKPSAAWGFVAAASHMSQKLGMHSKVTMAQDPPEIRAVKIKLFWLVYVQEKSLSLRLGRSSTIRDSDITIPVPGIDSLSEISYFSQLDKMKDLAHLQGKIYDQLYSSCALAQPQHIRTNRARRLAAELEKLYADALRQATSNGFLEAFVCTGKVIHLSLICLVYRAIPPEANQGTIFGKECISSAHKALEAHRKWMALLHSPFVPFIVIFCHIIETCDKSNLDLLESVIKTLQSATDSVPSSGVRKEYHLFKALYDAACSYIEARLSKANLGLRLWANTSSSADLLSPAHQQPVILTPMSNLQSSQTTARMSLDGTAEWMPQSFETPGGAELDQYGAQLGNWLHMNNQMTRALEDSYFWEDLM
ncbi:fungal specific transcription factor domain-containing protein [Aspergillus foveolatus]|uniref:fungal specific transcription factor domain-containing protein n=1 Tax=Aspergillus foveolatus TaxID=210207 RepID=UPI003CCD5D41